MLQKKVQMSFNMFELITSSHLNQHWSLPFSDVSYCHFLPGTSDGFGCSAIERSGRGSGSVGGASVGGRGGVGREFRGSGMTS
jgi:hypothetical protein